MEIKFRSTIKQVIIFLFFCIVSLQTAIAQEQPEWAKLVKQAQEYTSVKDYHTANKCYNKAIELVWSDRAHPEVQSFLETLQQAVKMNGWLSAHDSLNTLAWECTRRKEYEQSNIYYEQVISVLDSLGWNSIIPKVKYHMAHNDVSWAIELLKKERYEEARPYLLRALERDTVGSKSYYLAHNWLGDICDIEAMQLESNSKDLNQALLLCEEGEQHFEIVGKIKEVFDLRLRKAKMLFRLNRKQEALSVYNQIVASCKGVDSLLFLEGKALNGIGTIERENGNFKKAIDLLEEAYSLFDNAGINVAVDAFRSANELFGIYQFDIGDTVKAALWEVRAGKKQNEAFAHFDQLNSKSKGSFEMSQVRKEVEFKKAYVHAMKQQHVDIDKQIEELTVIIQKLESDSGSFLSILADCYISRGTAIMKKKNFESAASDAKRAIGVLNRIGAQGEKDKCSAWDLLSGCLWKCGDGKKALSAADSCVILTEAYYGTEHTETMDAYGHRGLIAREFGQIDMALNSVLQSYVILRRKTEDTFAYLTAQERWYYWDKHNIHTHRMPNTAYILKEYESAYTDSLYSEQLFTKGILLTTESALRRAVEGDSVLKQSYDKIRMLRKTALESDNLYEINRANHEADRLERELGTRANSLHLFTNILKTHVSDVKKNLPSGSAAIEFLEFTGDSSMVCALVLLPNKTHVQFVPLLSEKQLQKIANDTSLHIYNTGVLSRLIWGELANALDGVKTVYFSPAGNLHSIGIEYLPDFQDTTKRISDRWQLYRLSSTRELVRKKENNNSLGSAVYGGLRYDADTNVIINDSRKYPSGNRELGDNASHNITGVRGEDVIPYLPGTRIEALSVDSTLKAVKIDNKIFIDTFGTEASFKALSGQHKKMLLVSTHGKYWNDKRIIPNTLKSDNYSFEDMALTRSALFFTGSEKAYYNGTVPKGIDDGILTAKEIADLDFSGMDLVVLSACQSGLGDISGDGVFGLQRGFKKAGVNTIIMSLWNVDDLATLMLMSHFYDNLLVKKMTKKKALEEAQMFVRDFKIADSLWVWNENHESGWPISLEAAQNYVCHYTIEKNDWNLLLKGLKQNVGVKTMNTNAIGKGNSKQKGIIRPYQDPKFWAGFILMDGIE